MSGGGGLTAPSSLYHAVACSAFEPIRWSKQDSDETIRRIKQRSLDSRLRAQAIATLRSPPKQFRSGAATGITLPPSTPL